MITAAAKIEFPRYESYRDSGVDWLGEIPSHWEIQPFKALFRMSTEKNGSAVVGEMLSVSGYRGIEVKDYEHEEQKRSAKDLVDYRVVREGQLVVNTMWLNYAGLGVSDFEGHVSPAYRSYWISDTLDKRYAHHLLRSRLYVDGYTGQMQGIRPNSLQIKNSDFKRFPIVLPTLEEQQRIANFLDEKTAEIDEAIGKKERLIALLKEQKAILINHWFQTNQKPILLKRFLKRIEQGWSPDCSDSSGSPTGWGVLTAGCVNGGTYYQDRYKPLPARLKPRPSIEVKKGDILMSRANGSLDLIGSAAYVHQTDSGRMFSDKIFRLVPREEMVIPELLAIALGTPGSRKQIVAAVSGAGGLANNIGMGSIKNLTMSIPLKISSQSDLLAKVKTLNSETEAATNSLNSHINQLKEFKQTLIAHAVTGKLKVN